MILPRLYNTGVIDKLLAKVNSNAELSEQVEMLSEKIAEAITDNGEMFQLYIKNQIAECSYSNFFSNFEADYCHYQNWYSNKDLTKAREHHNEELFKYCEVFAENILNSERDINNEQ